MFRTCVAATIIATGVFSCDRALAATESQNFDVPPADWTELNNRDAVLGTDFGYSATNNAGGVNSGEAGGIFPRTPTPAYYADTALGGTLGFASPLHATGKLRLQNEDLDGRIEVGWFDQTDPPNKMDLIGFSLNDGGRQLQAVERKMGALDLGNTPSAQSPLMPNGLYNFTLSYDGAGHLQVTMADANNVNPPLVAGLTFPAATYQLNAFGIFKSGAEDSGNPPNPALTAAVFIDDLTYTSLVPEPGTLVLSVMVMGMVACRRERRERANGKNRYTAAMSSRASGVDTIDVRPGLSRQ